MRSFVLLGMLLCAIPSAADAANIVCRGQIIREWGYLSIMSTEGTECIITRRVGMQTVQHACHMGLEGIVAKRRDRPYRSGRSPDWIRVRTQTRQRQRG
jgi:hypothetical protein